MTPRPVTAAVFAWWTTALPLLAQPLAPPSLRAGAVVGDIVVDGSLDEAAWQQADVIDGLTMAEPNEGVPASAVTRVRVLAAARALYVGIECDDEPSRMVSYSKQRDADLSNEDYVQVVLGPFLDGRSGYVFAVNPAGARYDALIKPGGEDLTEEWDGYWDAVTRRTARGWQVEMQIPIHTLAFGRGLSEWHFNVERRIQRRLEIDRWSGASRNYSSSQTSVAGFLTALPAFDLGLGLTVRPALVGSGGYPAPSTSLDGELSPSLDAAQRLGSNFTASLTVNTDFAETEVDTRRTNLTRFPLFFPEKRTFFLEGADIFEFGLGLDTDVIPYFSRRIGLVDEREVPIVVGGKLNGRAGGANLGAEIIRTNDVDDLVPDATGVPLPGATMGVSRVKQNVLAESTIGAIATVGDPLGRSGSWLAGADFTYQTTKLAGDKNFLVGLWALAMDRDGLEGDKEAWGLKVDYPNDLWDVAFKHKRIGPDFDPSLGFVPRRGVKLYDFNGTFAPRPNTWLHRMLYEARAFVATDMANRWESYEGFASWFNWDFASGDGVEFNLLPTGERLTVPFEIADGVVIPPGTYEWRRYEAQASSAQKRRLAADVQYQWGGFYDGTLERLVVDLTWNPASLVTLEATMERNVGDLPWGDFAQTVVGTRARLNVSPNLNVSSVVQYDDISDSVGTNTRLRWTFRPQGDLFVVYNHNVRDLQDRFGFDSNQLVVKMQYAFIY